MKQQELEQLVEELAEAERGAAERIENAKALCDNRLEALRQQLEQRHRQEEEAEKKAFEQETRAQCEQLKTEAREKARSADRQIEVLKARHKEIRDALVQWLVARITRP